jgi:methylisocitrate lyase
MVDRIKAAVDARSDPEFFIMARTDAFAREGRNAAIDRACAYVEAGADGIFAEAVAEEDDYRAFRKALGGVPLLANMTEFGRTPLHNRSDLAAWGVDMVLYPLSAFRAMNRAAEAVYWSLLENDSQNEVVDLMQTRDELYDYLDYHAYEHKLDELFARGQNRDNTSRGGKGETNQ